MEPIVHILIPLVFLLLVFPKLDKKYVFYLLPLTFIIDLDTYIPGTHRYLFHNLLFVILISTIVYFAWDKRAYLVSLFYLGSHLILDLGEPGVAAGTVNYHATIADPNRAEVAGCHREQ